MSSSQELPRPSKTDFEYRPAINNEETMKIWYPFMLALGWDRGPNDLATYMDHSQSRGMILAFSRGSSTPIGHVSAVVNDNSTGWVAMFIVDSAYQGLGIGAGLWNEMMEDFRHCETQFVGLDAVPQQKATYERRGFVASKVGVVKVMSRPFSLESSPAVSSSKMVFVDIHEISAQMLAEYELKYTGFHRPKMWSNLLSRPDVIGFVELKSSSSRTIDDITALTVLRRCPGGARLGPLYAKDAQSALHLLLKTIDVATPHYVQAHPLSKVDMSSLSADTIAGQAIINAEVWSGNPAAVALFEELGWNVLGDYHRMWLNDKATAAQSKGGAAQTGLFAIFDAAIG